MTFVFKENGNGIRTNEITPCYVSTDGLSLNSQSIPIELSDDETIFEEEQCAENIDDHQSKQMDRGKIVSLCSDDDQITDKFDGTKSLKPFQCDLCGEQCHSDSAPRRHGKCCLFHGDLIHFRCTECGKTVKWRFDIKEHLDRRHKERVKGCKRKEDWDRFIEPINIAR